MRGELDGMPSGSSGEAARTWLAQSSRLNIAKNRPAEKTFRATEMFQTAADRLSVSAKVTPEVTFETHAVFISGLPKLPCRGCRSPGVQRTIPLSSRV